MDELLGLADSDTAHLLIFFVNEGWTRTLNGKASNPLNYVRFIYSMLESTLHSQTKQEALSKKEEFGTFAFVWHLIEDMGFKDEQRHLFGPLTGDFLVSLLPLS